MPARRTLVVQLAIVAACVFAITLLAVNFPFPSPLIKPLLPPKARWPTDQIEQWVERGHFGSGYLAYFARDPERTIPQGENLVSPADGIVKNVVQREGTTYLVVGLSFWDVHVVRTPVDGVVKSVDDEGTYLFRDASKPELEQSIFLQGKAAPVQKIVTLATQSGEVRVRLITSYWASRLKVWVHPGQQLAKGQRLGRIVLGSTVVAELPGRVELAVKAGERVVGGETVIFEGKSRR